MEKTKTFTCPLCEDNQVIYKKVLRGSDETHIWTCPYCPFVGLEYYDDSNIDDILRATKPAK